MTEDSSDAATHPLAWSNPPTIVTPGENTASSTSLFTTIFAAPMLMHGDILTDAIEQSRAAAGYKRVTKTGRWMEEVVTYEEERPLMSHLASLTFVLVALYGGVGLLFLPDHWAYATPLYGVSGGWVVVGVGLILTTLFQSLSGDVEVQREERRREETYYPPKAYWDTVREDDDLQDVLSDYE